MQGLPAKNGAFWPLWFEEVPITWLQGRAPFPLFFQRREGAC